MTTEVKSPIGEPITRHDGPAKVRGEYLYGTDLVRPGMLWGHTVRSPHVHARIKSIDTSAAEQLPGVHAILTAKDVPGQLNIGLVRHDQPALAYDRVRYLGEPVAIIAADHPELAREAAKAVVVDYEVLPAIVRAEDALQPDAPELHEGGNLLRKQIIRRGTIDPAAADVIVEGVYQVPMQDQAPLQTESGLACPLPDGGVELHISTQWLHTDQEQICLALALPPEKVRLVLAGVGGAFGAREDISCQIHLCLLALRTGRPVKMIYGREESFFGHVKRHPMKLWYRHGATRDGKLVFAQARILADGGAYASTSTAVLGNAAVTAFGPYELPNADVEAYVVYTNNPTCGAMRGFGSVQTCVGYEAQMDRLAEQLGLEPLDFRHRNALGPGSTLPNGQTLNSATVVRQVIERVRELPLPPDPTPEQADDLMHLPGGSGNLTRRRYVKRGVAYAVGIKNTGFSEGAPNYSTARVRLDAQGVLVETASAEVGQGFEVLARQIAEHELRQPNVRLAPHSTDVGSAHSTSASQQSWLSGGAVKTACEAVREELFRRIHHRAPNCGELRLEPGRVVAADGQEWRIADLLGSSAIVEEREFWAAPTEPLDELGQGHSHLDFGYVAHRAVVDVDEELGLVRVVQLATCQDVGRVMNLQGLEGQIEGGSAQGLGYAVMEQVIVRDGRIRNPSFTDYLLPTILDMPPVVYNLVEVPDPDMPYGGKGMAEMPHISSGPAIAAAVRQATGRSLTRLPLSPDDITGLAPELEQRFDSFEELLTPVAVRASRPARSTEPSDISQQGPELRV